MFADLLGQLAIVATFVQKVITLVKPAYQKSQYQRVIDVALALVVSGLLCVAWQIDAFEVAGIVFPLAWLGSLLTGVIAGAGANILNDVLVLLEMWKNQKKLDVAVKATALQIVDEAKVVAVVEEEK